MKPSFTLTDTSDLRRVQQDVAALADQFSPIAGGTILKNKSIGTAETTIAHGLRRVPEGWFPVSPQAYADVKQTKAPDSTFLYLSASVALTTNIAVF
jgi:hypothetical protein